MRTLICTFGLGLVVSAHGQLVNGGFEDGLNGWQVHNPVWLDSVWLTTEVPPGGGEQSLGLTIPGFDQGHEDQAIQVLGEIPVGTNVHFGGWVRSMVQGSILETPVTITLCTCDVSGYATPIGPGLIFSGEPYSWELLHGNRTITTIPPSGSTHCMKLGSGVVYQNLNFMTWFDELFVEFDFSTSTGMHQTRGTPQAFPNPASAKVRLDFPNTVDAITVIDATGCHIPLPIFQHQGRTLEVDVSSVPTGLCVMLLNTASGVVPVRFIKA